MLAAIAGTAAAHFASAALLGANPGVGRIDPHPERNALDDGDPVAAGVLRGQ